MTIRTPSWLQAGSYPAENDRLLLKSLLGGSPNVAPSSGVVATTDLAVTASGTPDMNVHVAAGAAFVPGTETTTQGVYGVYVDASVTVPIAAADATNARISLIVLQILDAGYSGASNIGQAIEVAGVPASSPVAPATPKNSIVLAQVLVAHSVTSITSAAITDQRTLLRPSPAYAQLQAAVSPSTTSATAAEVHASLRVSVRVGPSGMVRAFQSAVWSVPNGATACDASIYSATSSSGPWTATGAYPFNPYFGPSQVYGYKLYTGLTPGSTVTFYMGYSISGGIALTIPGASRAAAQIGTFQAAEPLG